MNKDYIIFCLSPYYNEEVEVYELRNACECINAIYNDKLLVAHKKHLPQCADKISELEAEGVESKDSVVMDLMINGH
ncbi:hypothetical protein [Clostridium beijerinckii]|uniref:Uncharacterized protein n=1 Tax=Clostridium beijerinckii TaxID=1520 RepID=A0A1S9NB40_CLOBE|nr:hypothetical protein [Clostridium beijerinckii]MZK49602.1 hypothetical protein [Clostridium beijerinckii]MZK58327.1 hypothetical protein [Clostridium beijerinckii]MZK68185.1 hypothetical protein [Clostridium beijerinckii]MZK73270.1 hypothetical protein [Clostridium beijerinckii]MZK83256.1 hypothetical protein [Clostridium beijerinckii]